MKRKYEIKPTATERIGKYALSAVKYVVVGGLCFYAGHSCDMSKVKQYSISDAEKTIKKTEKKVEHKKDGFLKDLEDRIRGLRR